VHQDSSCTMDEGEDNSAQQGGAMSAKERRAMLAKQRQKKPVSMVVSQNDSIATSSIPRSNAGSSVELAHKMGSSLVLSPSETSWLDEDETGAAIAIQPISTQPAKQSDAAAKFEKTMMEEGFQSEYTPKADSLRFEAKVAGAGSSSPAAKRPQEANVASGDYLYFDDLDEFVRRPAPIGMKILCCIHRDKSAGLSPNYTLRLERTKDGITERVFLLSGKKRKMTKTNVYDISTQEDDTNPDSYIGKLRSNFVGTQFTLYDDGVNPNKRDSAEAQGRPLRQELAAMVYDANVLGWSGPRKMTVIITGIKDNVPVVFQPESERDSLLERVKTGRDDGLLVLRNKQPEWNDATSSYVLNFHGRVTQASVKNFQIVHDSDPDYIIMQFGRNEENAFSMDFMHPMSALQAFAVALSSFAGKLACE
jgi:tubby-related protein 1